LLQNFTYSERLNPCPFKTSSVGKEAGAEAQTLFCGFTARLEVVP
jgi:hypothetical protein